MNIININSLSNEIYKKLKEFVENNDKTKSINHNAIVRKRLILQQYPLIVFNCRTNNESFKTKDNLCIEKGRQLSFEIDIYAIDDLKNEISSKQICEDLESIVTYFMQYIYKMKGGTDAKITNINSANATQYTLHFNCEWYINKNIIY